MFRALAAFFLAVFLAQGFYAIGLKSPAFDETGDIAAGLSYVQSGEVRANLQHPPLLKELAGVSLRLAGVRLAGDAKTVEMLARGGERAVGSQLIAEQTPARVMFWSRLPFLLLAAGLGLLLWWWGRELAGELAGLAALVLYTFDPTILGHSYLATMDVGLAAFGVLFLYGIWKYLSTPDWRHVVLCGVAMGLVLAAKFSAIFLLPVAAVLVLASGKVPWKTAAGHAVCAALVAAFVLQAVYLSAGGLFLYSAGLERVNADHNPDYLVYLGGQLQHSFALYFPMAYLLKEPLAAIVLLAFGAYALRGRPRMVKLFLALPPLAIFAAHMAFADDLGVRYIIPALPFLHLIGGVGAAWLIGKGMPGRIGAVVLGGWLAFAAFSVAPDQLSYFNEAAGGTKSGPQWLDDSNVDWGQALIQLKHWAQDRPVKLAYFGSIAPSVYGLNATPVSMDDLMKAPAPGTYAVSAHLVARLPAMNAGAEWLRHPTAVVGHAMYVYDVK